MERTISNPIFKDTVTFITTSAESNGKYSEMETWLYSKGGNPMHTHSEFVETFTALEGNLGIMLNGKKIMLSPGESVSIQKGEPHHFFNDSDKPVLFRCVFTPGHTGAENMLRIIYGLARDGQSNRAGVPKSLMTLALVGEIGNSALAGIMRLLNPLLRVLAARARKKGLEQILIQKYCR